MNASEMITALSGDDLVALHDRLHAQHGDASDPSTVEAHHLAADAMRKRGISHPDSADNLHQQAVTLSTVTVKIAELVKAMSPTEAEVVVAMAMQNGTSFADVYELLTAGGWLIRAIPVQVDGDAVERNEPEPVDKDTYRPPNAVQYNAQRALNWIAEGKAGQGFTDVGRARAAQLANGQAVSEETIRRMAAYFTRHQSDLEAEGAKQGQDRFPSAGRVAWDAWGGNEGWSWARNIIRSLDAETKQKALVVKQVEEQRFTLGPWYVPGQLDAHNEWTDDSELQAALWDYVRKGDRDIWLQHTPDTKAGEWVEAMTMPFPVDVPMVQPDTGQIVEKSFPAGTVFLGVVWEDWAWQMVKAGQIRGYSIGGSAQRIIADVQADGVPSEM